MKNIGKIVDFLFKLCGYFLILYHYLFPIIKNGFIYIKTCIYKLYSYIVTIDVDVNIRSYERVLDGSLDIAKYYEKFEETLLYERYELWSDNLYTIISMRRNRKLDDKRYRVMILYKVLCEYIDRMADHCQSAFYFQDIKEYYVIVKIGIENREGRKAWDKKIFQKRWEERITRKNLIVVIRDVENAIAKIDELARIDYIKALFIHIFPNKFAEYYAAANELPHRKRIMAYWRRKKIFNGN